MKYIVKDQYMQLFLKQNCLRNSCGENCKYRDQKRQSDITIADFKGLKDIFPKFIGNRKNYSSVIFNTKKSLFIEKKLKDYMKMYLCDISLIKQYNPLFYKQTYFSQQRQEFFQDYTKDNIAAIEKWTACSQGYRKNIKHLIYDLLPIGIKNIIIKYMRKR